MHIEPVPCLRDNYAYLVVDPARSECAVVDPSEDAPVRARIAALGLSLTEIWCTHHHPDHVGGVAALARAGIPVRGSRHDAKAGRIPQQTVAHDDEDTFELGGHSVRVLHVPGHTLGALTYLVEGAAFTGDTLFLAGCGRVFEGTMAQMQASLARLRALDTTTRIYCGHEYTASNLRFAEAVEPASQAIRARLERAQALRASGLPTVPGTLAEERATNPFLRWDEAATQEGAERLAGVPVGRDPASVFTALRQRKDHF